MSEKPHNLDWTRRPGRTPRVVLLYGEKLASPERNLKKLGEFVGINARGMRLQEALGGGDSRSAGALCGGETVFVRAETLARHCESEQGLTEVWRRLVSTAKEAFVFGFEPCGTHNKLLNELTSGEFSGVEPATQGVIGFTVSQQARALCGSLSGQTLGLVDAEKDCVFRRGTGTGGTGSVVSLIGIGTQPCFAAMQRGGCRLFLATSRMVADLDESLPLNTSALRFFSSLVPFMMVFRWVAGEAAWHDGAPRACFIIDDPPLKLRYGFLDFRKLVEVLRREECSASVAFIPWNYRRSDSRAVEFFKTSPESLSLCIHGCDHTWGEFGGRDGEALVEKSRRALVRMAAHQRLSGLPFDEVMVFPQGLFSAAAMKALRAVGYVAAVNTTAQPVEDPHGRIALRELLDVAITRFSGFPLFGRRYPQEMAELAFDLFLGKPALLVEHHEFFRNGYDALAETVRQAKALEPRLQWTGLGRICSRACLKRVAEDRAIQLRFYGDRFQFQHAADRPGNYTLVSQTLTGEPAPAILINGQRASYQREEGWFRLNRALAPGDRLEVRPAADSARELTPATDQHYLRRAGVFLRRHLSEFRENYIQPNRLLSGARSSAGK